MPMTESLDALIARKAAEFADRLRAAAAIAANEEDVRIATETQLAFIQQAAGIILQGQHEFTVASGRIDSVYSRVIIEYKNPKSADRIGPTAQSPGSGRVIAQIKRRFYDMRDQHGQSLTSLFGVGLDGNHFIFVRFRDEKWQVQQPVEVNRHSAERFLWVLFNLGNKGKPFSPEYLAADFGSGSSNTVATAGIHALYNAIASTHNPKAQVLFSQWKIFFGEVCGYDVDDPSDKLNTLAAFYSVDEKTLRPAELLFAVHTYYALFMKLLASELVAFSHNLPTPLQKLLRAVTSATLKREVDDLEAGGIFRHLSITNFLEGDLFSWYADVWSEPIESLVRSMVARLDDYNPGTLSEDPSGSRDLLKKLYQDLFPRTVRHDLGEYYTPDWLAEHVLDELGYDGNPDKRLLDPACGSGTFLVMAINRIRRWYEEHRDTCRLDESALCRKIISNIVGFDLNPLAVMASRTNYLIAIRGLMGHMDNVELPVYLCDSVMTPSEYGGVLAISLGKARELKTAAATFVIPAEIAKSREDLGKYAEVLESCVRNGYSEDEFGQRCRDEGLTITEHALHSQLYLELVRLDRANKNGVWARIIKNAFAPLFIGRVDYVAGNPPWVNWRNLPPDYRKDLEPIWQKYDLFSQRGLRARLGAGMDDICVLMTYVCGNEYLRDGGRLGFVLTQTLFQSAGGGQGFRRFALPAGRFLKVEAVHDFTAFQPFDDVSNRTATVVWTVSDSPTVYPIPYKRVRLRGSRLRPESYLDDSESPFVTTTLDAAPVGGIDSPWSIVPIGMAPIAAKVLGVSHYTARVGVHSGGAASVYWVDINERGDRLTLITNRNEAGRNKYPLVTAAVETALVKPLLRGRDVRRWHAAPSLSIVMPYDDDSAKAITEARMKREYPRTFEYFETFKVKMLKRPHYLQHFRRLGAPYWSMYNVGAYSFAPWRVVWREQTSSFQCTVLDEDHDLSRAIADAKLVVIPCESAGEAHFLAAVLNSSPSRFAIDSYVVKVQVSTHVLDNIAIPTYRETEPLHRELARHSRLCHAAARAQKQNSVAAAEDQIDALAASLWRIDDASLRTIQEAVEGAPAENDPEAELALGEGDDAELAEESQFAWPAPAPPAASAVAEGESECDADDESEDG